MACAIPNMACAIPSMACPIPNMAGVDEVWFVSAVEKMREALVRRCQIRSVACQSRSRHFQMRSCTFPIMIVPCRIRSTTCHMRSYEILALSRRVTWSSLLAVARHGRVCRGGARQAGARALSIPALASPRYMS
eukprot:1513124-Prymnesium_polylepis.2